MARLGASRYTSSMETVVRNVRDLSCNERSTAEQLVGHALQENQQLVIQVIEAETKATLPAAASEGEQLPDWCNVYEGLTEERIAALEQAISRRLDLTRPSA
jgi:hypothetical protein